MQVGQRGSRCKGLECSSQPHSFHRSALGPAQRDPLGKLRSLVCCSQNRQRATLLLEGEGELDGLLPEWSARRLLGIRTRPPTGLVAVWCRFFDSVLCSKGDVTFLYSFAHDSPSSQ